MLDFGKIIIYTSNLRIIRAPPRRPEAFQHQTVPHVDFEGYPKTKERGSRRRAKAPCTQDGEENEGKQISDTEMKVMVLGQIILSGAVGFLSPRFCFLIFSVSPCPSPDLPSFFLCICLQPSFLHFIFSFKGITAGLSEKLYCNSVIYLVIQNCSLRGVYSHPTISFVCNCHLIGTLILFFSSWPLLLQQPLSRCPSAICQL